MNRSVKVAMLTMLLALFLAGEALAIDIFVWRHDNNLRCTDPVLGGNLTATESVLRTLRALGLDFDSSSVLPDDLSDYDVVITCLSYLCPG